MAHPDDRREPPNRPDGGPPTYSGRRVRQGYIALNTPRRRGIFFSGLVGFILLVLLAAWIA